MTYRLLINLTDTIANRDESPVESSGRGRYFPVLHPPVGMSTYTVRGRFPARDGPQEFETEVDAPNENVAEERAFSTFGSRHGLKRRQIEIEEVSA